MEAKKKSQLLDEYLTEFKDKILDLLQKYGVKRAELFGSIVRREMKEDSDIDILVEFEEGRSLLDLVGLKLELEELLGREVDIVTYRSLHPLIKEEVFKEKVTLMG